MNVDGVWEQVYHWAYSLSGAFAVLCSRWSTYMYTNLTKVLLLITIVKFTPGEGIDQSS